MLDQIHEEATGISEENEKQLSEGQIKEVISRLSDDVIKMN
jgi:hypothetical protein